MKKVFLSLVSLLILSTMVLASSASEERKPGVAVGDWFKYDVGASWSSNDPDATFPPYDQEWLDEWNQTEWILVGVESVSGTNITFQATTHYRNGSEKISDGSVDVYDGRTNLLNLIFISADLGVGDTLYVPDAYVPPAPSYPRSAYPPEYIKWRINETTLRTYLDVEMETNHLITTTLTDRTANLYWHRQTGVLLECKTITQTGEYQTTWSASLRITESNVSLESSGSHIEIIWLWPVLSAGVLMLVGVLYFSKQRKRQT